jgi:UPF0271 protein
MQIDLNADLGEGCGNDEAILEYVSSINVACGWHAGSAAEMLSLVRAARSRGVAIGAHPSFPDRANFGRREMNLPLSAVRAGVLYQVGALEGIVRAEGGELAHVKAHGALYNQCARDPELAQCVARTIRDFNPKLPVMGLAGSCLIAALREEGVPAIEEGFADRRYTADGHLTERGFPGALMEREADVLAQVLSLVRNGTAVAVDGSTCRIRVETICLHGDGPHALAHASAIGAMLRRENIEMAAIRKR